MFDQIFTDFDAAADRFAATVGAVHLQAQFDDAVTPHHFGQLAGALSDVIAAFGTAQQDAYRMLGGLLLDE